MEDVINFKFEEKISYEIENDHQKNEKVLTQEIVILTPLNSKIKAFLVTPTNPIKQPGLIFVHWLETHAKNSNKTEFLETAIFLAENHGFVSILPDAFWSTTPEEFKNNPVTAWNTQYENDSLLNKTQLLEILYSINLLKTLPYVDEAKIGYCGHDFGAMFGCLVASFEKDIKTYVFMTPTGKFSDWYRFGNKLETVEQFHSYTKEMQIYDPQSNVRKISPNSVLFQFSLNDFYVPVEKALDLYNATKEPKYIMWYKAGHGLNEQAYKDAKNWLIKNI